MCNGALTEIDGATDVVAPSPQLKERAGVETNDAVGVCRPRQRNAGTVGVWVLASASELVQASTPN